MWSKVANAFKRSDVDASSAPSQHDGRSRHSHDESASDSAGEPAGVLSPPGSPSKSTKRGLLRRGSRHMDKENGGSLSLAKRVKSSLHLNTNINESNLSLTSAPKPESATQPVFGSVRSIFGKDRRPSAMQMQAAMNRSDDALNRASTEGPRPTTPTPLSPLQGTIGHLDTRQFGSVRSILRDRNTPGSGQNVRFFSRDAYHVISPNTSTSASADNTSNSADALETPFMQRIQEMSPDRDGIPTATSTPYVTPEANRAHMDPDRPQISAIFDFSAAQEHSVHSIRGSANSALRDNAVEIDEFDRPIRNSNMPALGSRPTINVQPENRVSSHSTASTMSIETPNSIINGSESSLRRLSDNDETRFHSLADDGGEKHSPPGRSGSSLGFHRVFKRESLSANSKLEFPGSANASSRVRALSERVFSKAAVDDPKAKLGDPQTTPNAGELPDPFSADASNYYNPAAGFPKTPPRLGHVRSDSGVSGMSMQSGRSVSTVSHRSGTSRSSHGSVTQTRVFVPEDDMVASLRTQLAFHQELAAQYELDIRARDTHAALMSQKLQAHEAEAERRAKAMRGMRRRVAELERAAAALEEQAERSALESFERSVMDGASGDALRVMQQQMVELERERNEMAHREREAKAESEKLMEELRHREEALQNMKKRLESGISSDQVSDGSLEDVRIMLAKTREEAALASQQHQEIEFAWAVDRESLLSEMEALQKEINAKTGEIDILKSEVEAQWGNTEKLNEKADALRKERDDLDREREHLKNEIATLERRITDMEDEWTENENRKGQLENEFDVALAARQEVERERDQLRQELERLGAHGGDYNSALADLEAQVKGLMEERQHAYEDAQRLEQMLAEATERAQRASANDHEVEQLRAELSSMHRDHEQALAEAHMRASDAAGLRNETARRQAATEAEAKELRERLAKLQEEADKLRSSVQVLKQQSADQDVKILQLEKQHDQDIEDKLGLNIALDSKQQELELIKRGMGVRGTAGATPAVATRGARRDSTAFKTPIPLRPASSLSDGAKRPPSSLSDTDKSGKLAGGASSTVKSTLGRTTRTNVASGPSAPTATVRRVSGRLSDTSLSAPPGRARAGSVAAKAPIRPTAASAAKRVVSPNSTTSIRRASSTISGIAPMSDTSSSALSDKENETPRARPVNDARTRRMSMQPLAVPA
ncbi:uncharacterized protein FOMMEDRAFT_145639 [Fomitiporia mediterranea MF3/22]|uniref:uncharacterized protein n=1 Tax=Fomitiporia mediterranea (strain MF3/22) TaxID=694068 RepID=UPI00044099CE|nr:uncharacterized protein FOMMEDRAFT_145639 [Fomitiporia mediterranea MF3/22]EJD04953.1 hypothetical protein FOMMEDRAFT_145639 [Fomitiporia mediterranea MF3/22]